MYELADDIQLSPEAAAYIAMGLRGLAGSDGYHPSELALIESFERDLGLRPSNPAAFSLDEHPLTKTEEFEAFLRTAHIVALADGRLSAREQEWLARAAVAFGISEERRNELAREARKFLLRTMVAVNPGQGPAIGKMLGLSDAEVEEALSAD